MKAPKTLRPPSNWQDFEKLCKQLWGEIWKCPEIVRHGRAGQVQHGVDVYGIPTGENEYYGIQCKGKDENLKSQFSKDEVISEVEKAKKFSPPLKKYYLATTAPKDTKIEEYVRNINLENKKAGLFEVYLFSWEDIVDLIDANKETHDLYLNSQNYKTNKNAIVTFRNNLNEITLSPRFEKIERRYRSISLNKGDYAVYKKIQSMDKIHSAGSIKSPPLSETLTNLSYSPFQFIIFNSGIESLEQYKLLFEFKGEIETFSDNNTESKGLHQYRQKYISDILKRNEIGGEVIPLTSTILVGDDKYISDEIFLKPYPKEYEIIVEWKLISNDYKQQGELKILVNPYIETRRVTIWEDDIKGEDEDLAPANERVEEEFKDVIKSE
ncbi:MAG: hypothetical protein V4613_09560 [Bacteroidota bacterium]